MLVLALFPTMSLFADGHVKENAGACGLARPQSYE